MIKISKAHYIAYGQLNKLNKSTKDFNHLENLYKFLEEALWMMHNGNYCPKKLSNKFPGRKYLQNIDFTESFHVYSTIEPDIWFELQTILKDITGRIWEMDQFLDLLITWFIYVYKDRNINSKKLPFIRRKNSFKKRFLLIRKFEKRFGKYYKNIMGDWD